MTVGLVHLSHFVSCPCFWAFHRHRVGLTFVRMVGVVRSTDNSQTSRIALLQLLIVHRDRDFIGNTITMNLQQLLLYWKH
jgi:hypothetical protein